MRGEGEVVSRVKFLWGGRGVKALGILQKGDEKVCGCRVILSNSGLGGGG